MAEQDTFYKSFSEKTLTGYGSGRRTRIEQHRLALLHRYRPAPGYGALNARDNLWVAGGLFFAEVLEEAGVPAGVFNVVTCSRESVAQVGDALLEHPLVKGISFTGSTAVGRHIAAKCGAYLKKCCVELGGKDLAYTARGQVTP